ncbi:MAG TPA: hemerythrin domain-containing protein [Burkholderiales bacterium]|nr:hemerythrin domain-containing protein [Burkholderiales bacterium]
MKDPRFTALQTIRDEHRSISAVLFGMKELARMTAMARERPDFRPLRSMLRYVDEYPERLHHPKEDDYLFARLAERAPETRPLIERLKGEHAKGAELLRELQRSFIAMEEAWPEGTARFREAVDAYAQFHWDHMSREEKELLPLAERHLGKADWEAIAAAFSANTNPIADVRERDFDTLFARIVNLAPAPVGLGDPWARPA